MAAGITTSITDESLYIPSNPSINVALVGAFKKGPTNEPFLTGNQTQFLNITAPEGKPKIGYPTCYQSALDYLAGGGNLWCVRAVSATNPPSYAGVVISKSGNSNHAITTKVTDPESYDFLENDCFLILSANQGAWGNDIAIKIDSSEEASDIAGAFVISVYRVIPGTSPAQYTQLETFTVSRNVDQLDGTGRNIYVETRINGISNYIRVVDNTVVDSATGVAEQSDYIRLERGSDGDAVTDGDLITALKTLEDKKLSIQLVMNGGITTPAFAKAIDSLCAYRDDETFGILTTPADKELGTTAVTNLIEYRTTSLGLNTYRCSLYTPHVEVYDRFNDRYTFVSPDGMIANRINASIIGNNSYNFPAAGYRRGVLNEAYRVNNSFEGGLDNLAKKQINVIRKDPNRGQIVIMDDQTLWSSKSDLQSQPNMLVINLQIRPGLREALKDYLFELHDPITRNIVKDVIDGFMRTVVAQRSVSDFYTVCDTTNNTDNDIANGIMNIGLYVKMIKSIKYIHQNVIATAQGVDFGSLSQAA